MCQKIVFGNDENEKQTGFNLEIKREREKKTKRKKKDRRHYRVDCK